MRTYDIPLVPGPVSVPVRFREAYMTDFGSSDLEKDFYELLKENQRFLKDILKTKKQRYHPVRRSDAHTLGGTQEHRRP